MQNQEKLIYITLNDLNDLVAYLKDYSTLMGKSYHYAQDIITKQQIATLNFDINKMIKKLEKEIERK